MKQIEGYYWPDDVGESWQHALRHLKNCDRLIEFCPRDRRRQALQAGGNMGLWPMRLAAHFERVVTLEPDERSRGILEANVYAGNVDILPFALGAVAGTTVSIQHRGLGSHNVIPGADVTVTTIDEIYQHSSRVDLIQLDVEGYEVEALSGGIQTIIRCKPVIMVEMRNFTEKYGSSDAVLRQILADLGYAQVAELSGCDFVFKSRD